ncbi:RDD family protein [Puniceibacterium sediminis]|uniref:RDD family protein n=1 Tax=Puniceibacterium sediminis TaxID=1608407 RepID=A0A238XNV7_9RHOB|nr:RDD family protein [Puniceibacterium sediminis]SNR60268.1 RDD family protein [Puniceibacterium sediminis]
MYSQASYLPDPVQNREFYADVPVKRAIAWIIDVIVVAALVVPAVVFTAFIGLFFLVPLYLVLSFAYRTITIANGSATWGMRLMAIELRDALGQRLNLGQAFLHTLGYSLSLSFMPVQLISAVCMCATERGQGVTDMALGTVMINRRS